MAENISISHSIISFFPEQERVGVNVAGFYPMGQIAQWGLDPALFPASYGPLCHFDKMAGFFLGHFRGYAQAL